MTEEIQEQVSAFIDGELPEAEGELLVRRLATDASLREEAARQMRLSQAIRGETSVADTAFSARVLAAIHDEPTLEDTAAPAAVTPSRSPGWMRMAAGSGIVAGVAAIALLALPDAVESPTVEAQTAGIESAETAGLPDAAEPFEYTVPASTSESGLVNANPELAAYYLKHSVNAPSLAPVSGRVRMLSSEPADAADPELDEQAAGASR